MNLHGRPGVYSRPGILSRKYGDSLKLYLIKLRTLIYLHVQNVELSHTIRCNGSFLFKSNKTSDWFLFICHLLYTDQ